MCCDLFILLNMLFGVVYIGFRCCILNCERRGTVVCRIFIFIREWELYSIVKYYIYKQLGIGCMYLIGTVT